ncbi:unnamed protein product [Paramecium pentaurelia]|uniref:Transmembrane protein n=1 Tax=Paramecium pentaurelia TaxID=43138 RepID=A0A8S1Y9D3_9CILI|nr:unnamed protein product [Paramecium pentaurelia]
MMKKSTEFFKNLDIFGQNIQLNFNGQNQYQTATGGFFSLAIIAVIAFFFQQNIIDFLNRVEIHLNTQTIFDFNPDSIQFNEDNYMFALAVDQPNFIGRPFFNITIKQRIYTRSPNGTLNKDDRFIDLIPCTKDRFQKIFKNQDFSSQFSQLKLEEWLCPELNYSIKLGGSFTSEVFEFVKITVSECSNNSNSNSILSWKPECASTQARDRYLQQERSFRIRMYMTNNVINPLQVQNVSQTFFDDESYFSFLLSTGTEADVFYQKYNITTDDNIIPLLKKVDEEVINVKRAGDFKTKIVQNNDQQFSAIYLRRSPYTYIIRRELQDIADLLSYLGGFANIVAIIFGVIIKTYNKSRFMIELANHVYDFPMKNASVAESQERKEIKKTIAKAKSRTIVVQHQHQDQDLQSPIQSNKHSQNQLLLYDTKQQEQYNISKQDEIYQKNNNYSNRNKKKLQNNQEFKIGGTLNKDDRFIDLIPCTKDRFQKIFKNQDFSSQFSQLKLEEWLCPELNYSIKLGGSFTSEVFEFVKITVSECSNNSNSNSILSWKPECASTQARDRYLQQERSFRIRMYMTNNVINPLQVQNVSQTFFDDESYFSFLLSTGTEADVFYQKYNITTDDNIIPLLKKVDEEVINVKRAGDFKTKIVQNNDQQFSAIYLRRSPYTYIIRRELQDIADLLSYLGGFANIVAIIFGVIIKTYNKSRFMIELANHVYDFPMKNASVAESQERKEIKKTIAKAKSRTIVVQHQHQDQDLQSPIQSNKHSQNQLLLYDTKQQEQYNISKQDEIYQVKSELQITNRQEEQQLFQQEQEKIIKQLGIQDRKSYFTQQIQKILNRSKPLLFNCKYILSKFFCSKLFYDRNSILLRKAIKKINKDLDICVILDTVKEINLIKELLLTQDQLILFDFAPKQVINLQEEEQKSMTRSLVRRSLESMRTNSNSQESQQQNETIFAYYKLFQAYDHIHQSLQQNNKINEKLIEKLGQEVKDIFEVSHFIQWDNKSIKCLKDDVQSDSVNSDPLCINNIEQIKINMNINT